MDDPLPPQFERTRILLTPGEQARLANAHVLVAGLGGVGSYCAEALARAGVGRLTIVDHDTVALSNINRQLPALLSTAGQSKAELMAARIRDIHPGCRLTVLREFLVPETVAEVVPDDTDFVVDCIDSLNCKVALVACSVQRGLHVASSMGAGNKLDPTRIRIADISRTCVCPLASVMRKRLRKRGIAKGVLTVFSDEPGRAPLPPQPVEGRGRARAVNGTISYMPPLFGLMLAGAVVQRLIGAS
ncbi:MAG: tRNA threonylcarbamoyladenosine dehydratase [Thiobacillus sp. SCN 64-35]|jgi:tRNA A37 threonylcarbamoyladenosine dehydratase|nr:tRNA threonylcarbamoyladenosine dehydratase [Betaproteobacteria bacterium SCN1]MBN8761564.1 tRNA threonylcarbamoyladenosine dehydratase [Thiobacillus sp.]ODU12124.1 MAG: tRNA threonylcarbamoyladenosine dehydratase [Thiobacillus sp. SCN 64-35]ODU88746.1 MAG: tRNA threonylcarbamoyladenosine dehydratase [Thiobacillus sp. SCN 65-179]OJW39072.1 MAG: tRNA threonylcarbamoyladenosine dehydratase [Thiobacillus sp. 65-69]